MGITEIITVSLIPKESDHEVTSICGITLLVQLKMLFRITRRLRRDACPCASGIARLRRATY